MATRRPGVATGLPDTATVGDVPLTRVRFAREVNMIDRYDFWARPLGLRRMMDRLFEDAFVVPDGRQLATPSSRTMNVYEEDGDLVLEAHLPGFKPEDIDVSVEQGILTIRGQTRAAGEQKDRRYFLRERQTDSFVRSLRLPASVDVDAARATFKQGVLRLEFPRTEQARPRRVPIAPIRQAAISSVPSADTPARSSGQALDTPAQQTGEVPSASLVPSEAAASKAPKGKPAGGRAPRRKAAEGKPAPGKTAHRKAAAKTPAGA